MALESNGIMHCAMMFADDSASPNTNYSDVPDLSSYEEILVMFSGGKDSIACVLSLLELGVPPEKIELHHHLVDGREGSTLMDWPVTESYCKAFAKAFGLRFVVTWKVGGIEREMNRNDAPTAAVMIPDSNGKMRPIGGKGPNNTRLKFPQVTSDHQTRWCSGYSKIDVGARYLNNTDRFADGKKRLIVTGERAQESPARSKYVQFCIHPQDNRDGKNVVRYLDHWRAVLQWKETDVWTIMEKYGVNPHPSYKVGFSRCSCQKCIFIDNDGWATVNFMDPKGFRKIADYETQFGYTIDRALSVTERADKGTILPGAEKYGPIGMSKEYLEPIIVKNWELPAGAFKSNGGRF
jgi:3'-phosphoadenosine 5'-phosphosulfate sulfotransferase (PAPS reductase)/FAD synthetase